MQSRSAAYLTIMANTAHTVEWRVTINGTVYGQDKLVYSAGGGNGAPRLTRQMFSGTQPEVGRAVSAQFTCAVMEASSAIPRMASVVPAYRIAAGSSTSEWITLGTFYIDTRQTDKVTSALLLTCYDRMLVADGAGGKSYADLTGFDEWPQTMAAVVNEIAGIIGISVDARTTIRTGTGYNVEYPNDLTMREVLQQIAAAHAGNWCITPANSLRLVPLTGTSDSLAVGAAATGLKVAPTMAAWTGATVYWADEEAFEAGTDTGRVLTCDCLWATQETANGIVSILSGSAYQPYTASGAIIDMALELGDSVTVGTTGQTVTGPVWSIDLAAGLIEQADIAAPGEDEIDHEYPYLSYTDRSLRRKVALGQAYYGVTISRKNGLEIARTDGRSEALFNSDVFAMRALIDGTMKDRIYFDPVKGDYVFDGALGADAVFTDSLYAEQGDIAELTVDRLSTSRRVRLYNLRNTGDDNYLEIQDNYLRLITGTVIFESGSPLTEQATNRHGNPLYWSEIPYSINAQGYPLDEDGNQIYATTDQPTPGEGETLDDYKVMVYQYNELTKAELAFVNESGTYVPMLIMGAGDNNGRTKGILHKAADGFDISFTDSAGVNQGLKMNSAGYMDLYGLRKPTELDFSGWDYGYFTEELDGSITGSFIVDFDSSGRPVKITDGDGHQTVVVW